MSKIVIQFDDGFKSRNKKGDINMIKFEDIDCYKCEMYIPVEKRDCKECSRVYNEVTKDLPLF